MKRSEKPIRLFRATGVVMTATLISAGFGLIREMLVAYQFGATAQTDAYFFCFELVVRLPEFLLAALTAGLIPVYTRCKEEGRTAEFVSTALNVYVLFLALVGVVMMICAPFIALTLGSGFDAATRQLVVRFLWILSPALVLTGIWGVCKTILDAERRFFVSSVSQAALSLGIIVSVLLLSPHIGIGSLPAGILLALVIQVGWVVYWLRRVGFRYRPQIDLRSPEFQRFLSLLGPGLFGSMIGALIPILDKSMASHLAAGSVAALSFAGRPMGLLSRLAVSSFVTAMLPTLSIISLRNSRDSFRATVTRVIGILIFVITPLSILLAVLRRPIIQLLFERGNFGPEATLLTSNIFAGMVLGLMPMAVAVTVSTVFKSLEDTKTPAVYGAGSNLIAKIVLNSLFIAPFGAVGLAAASSLRYVVSGVLLLILLQRRLQGSCSAPLAKTLGKVLPASVLACVPAYLMVDRISAPPLVAIVAGGAACFAIYTLASALLGVRELRVLWDQMISLKTKRALGNA